MNKNDKRGKGGGRGDIMLQDFFHICSFNMDLVLFKLKSVISSHLCLQIEKMTKQLTKMGITSNIMEIISKCSTVVSEVPFFFEMVRCRFLKLIDYSTLTFDPRNLQNFHLASHFNLLCNILL